jgi:hypothetical protein
MMLFIPPPPPRNKVSLTYFGFKGLKKHADALTTEMATVFQNDAMEET